jgi:hypothetical protein
MFGLLGRGQIGNLTGLRSEFVHAPPMTINHMFFK